MCIVENDSVSWLVAWGGAFAFACLFVASTFKRRKKIRSPERRSREDDLDLDASGFRESTGCTDVARRMEGLKLLLQSSPTDLISRSCHTRSEMLVEYASIEDSNFDKNRTLTTEPILEKNEDEKIVMILYEEEEYPDSEKSVENEAQKYYESSKAAEESCSSFIVFDEATWLAEWTDKSSTTSSSSSEASSHGVCSEKIEGDNKIIDIAIHIDDDENEEDEKEARAV